MIFGRMTANKGEDCPRCGCNDSVEVARTRRETFIPRGTEHKTRPLEYKTVADFICTRCARRYTGDVIEVEEKYVPRVIKRQEEPEKGASIGIKCPKCGGNARVRNTSKLRGKRFCECKSCKKTNEKTHAESPYTFSVPL